MKINISPPFAIIQKLDSDEFLYLQGQVNYLNEISQIETRTNNSELEEQFISFTMIPFHQAHEKGYKVHKSKDQILSLNINSSQYCSFKDILDSFKWKKNNLQELNFELDNHKYKKLIHDIINKEIANGEGCNFVIPRKVEGKIEQIDINQALTIFSSLVQQDYGTYWKFIFCTGDRYFIGSTPERHLEVIDNQVRMNPVSGTFFKKKHHSNKSKFKKEFVDFLCDQKEINELFMVLEEELKMMCKMTNKGGMVIGPILKEMSKLIHTEYLLSGIYDKSKMSILDVLKESLFATTVTGSPLKNAFNIIHKYETSPRRYYGASVVLIGKNKQGKQTLDSPILIRTLDIQQSGNLFFGVGSTLVRNSNIEKELEETFVKSGALLNSLYQDDKPQLPRVLTNCLNDDDIYIHLHKRNQELSKFWFFQQHNKSYEKVFNNHKVIIINNEDDFCFMLQHLLSKMGLHVQIINYELFNINNHADIYIVGPGPGNPNDMLNDKMSQIGKIIKQVEKKKFIAICLGHQLFCKFKGFNCQRLLKPMQGEIRSVNYFGKQYLLGFYNTFIPVYNKLNNCSNTTQFSLDESNNIMAIRGDNFASMQFHPESILSEYGYDILKQELLRLL